MTSRAKRLTLILGVAALVAAIAGSVMAPELLAAPKDKGGSRFTITTEEVEVDGGTSGTFVASGAIEGTGTAGQTSGIGMVSVALRSDAGWLNLEVSGGKGNSSLGKAFEVIYASGDYTHLLGATGQHSAQVVYPTGPDGPFVIYRTFRGSVPK